MYCKYCGTKNRDTANFCKHCGMKIAKKTNENITKETITNGSISRESDVKSQNLDSNTPIEKKIFIQIVAGVGAFLCVVMCLYSLYHAVFGGILMDVSWFIYSSDVFTFILSLVKDVLLLAQGVVFAAMTALLAMCLMNVNKENSETFFVTIAEGSILEIVLMVIRLIFVLITGSIFGMGTWIASTVVVVLIVMCGLFVAFNMCNIPAITNYDINYISELNKNAINVIKPGEMNFNMSGSKTSTQNAYSSNGNSMNSADSRNENSMDNIAVSDIKTTGTGLLNDQRNIVLILLLLLITCSFYHYYFIWSVTKDINIACRGDGEQDLAFWKYICFGSLTCGVYAIYYLYKIGNRLASNSQRYGMFLQENGTTVLMWYLFGSMLCGIGPFMALHIIVKNTNIICHAYNEQILSQQTEA